MEFGLPLSALSLSAFYIFLAAALHRRKIEGMRLLTEAFLALGVVFGSLAVPLALDGRWTAAAWAMEGAALVWIGIRQERLLARNFGLLLQIGAGVVFFSTLNRPGSVIPVFNGLYLGCLAISLAALFSAFYLDKNASRLRKWEKGFHWFMLFWGLVWWFGAGIHEIDEHLPYRHLQPSFLLFFVASFQIMGLLFRTLGWKALRVPSAFLLPVLCLFAAFDLIDWPRDHPFARWGLIPWGLGFFTHFFLMKTLEKAWKPRILNLWHIGGILLFIGILSWESGWWTHRLIHDGEIWRFAPLGIIPALTVLVFMKEGERMPWPVKAFPLQYLGWTPALLSLYLWVWAIAGCSRRGDPDPLPYFPILNPLELSAALALFTVIGWAWTAGTSRRPDFDPETFRVIHGFTGAGVFLWLNSIVARTLHHWGGVPFTGSALFRSVRFQAAASLLWTSTAFAIMAFGSRRQLRKVWYGGAILLGAVVVKLFFIDLSGSGTVGRIISFTGVGILILIIGFICPLPGETEASSPNKKEI